MPTALRAPRALSRAFLAFGAALLLLAIDVGTARAQGGSLTASGLHLSTGTLVDPNGRTWISDHNAGFCRVTEPTDTSTGHIEHPQTPDAPGKRTCLGGLLPDAGTGPDAAGQPALFDPSPEFPDSGDELAFIPDGASASAEVVRARWNAASGLFEYMDTVTMQGDRARPTSVSLGPDENLYVVFQREDSIQRIVDPAGAPFPEVVGQPADGRAPIAVAAGRDAAGDLAVYVAETTGVRVLRPDADSPPDTDPVPFAVPDALGISSLSYDLERDVLWGGTSDATLPEDEGIDEILSIDIATNAVDRNRATGFTGVGGVNVRPSGHVMVVDDPGLIAGEPIGTGRMYHVGLPVARVDASAFGSEEADGGFTNDSTPEFQIDSDGGTNCLLRGPGVDTGWDACGAVYTVGSPLADGAYTLSVRSTVGGETGLPEAFAFTVDTQAPVLPVIVRPADATTVSATPWYEFNAELHARFACRFDDESEFSPCVPGRTRSFDENGSHTLAITAMDRAGNVSEPSTPVTYTVDTSLEPTPPPGWGTGPIAPGSSSQYAGGLHIPTGSIVDPNGRLWVADHNAGFCRVSEPTEDGPATIEHPQVPGGPGPHTCLGGLLPEALPGADAAGQPTLVDPSPNRPGSGDEVVLVPDGASASASVFRHIWNPDSGLFEPLDSVTLIGDRPRPVTTSLGPDGSIYVVFQRDGNIQRISSPAGPNPQARIVGLTSDGEGATAAAAGRDENGQLVVWVAEKERFAELRPNAAQPPATTLSDIELPVSPQSAEPIAAVSAMLWDRDREELWIGTADAALPTDIGIDVVHKVHTDTGQIEEAFVGGYTAVGGLGLRPDGILYVLDDPALVDPLEPLGLGRMFQVGMPAAHIVRGPVLDNGMQAADRHHTSDRTPVFEVEGDAVPQCRLTGGSVDTGWNPCPADGRFTPAAPLDEGQYLMRVRSVDGEHVGLVESHRFTVDTTAPSQPGIISPANGAVVSATPWFEFASEENSRYSCRWDASATYEPCESGWTRTFTENATHTLRIRATDRAGNVSAPSNPVTFQARGRVTAVQIDSGPEGRTSDNTPTFTFSADAPDVEFGCRLVGTTFTTCNSPKTFGELVEGTYTFEVRGRDAAGNVTPLTRRTFVVDQTGPVPTVAVPAADAVVAPSFSILLIANEPATWRCRIDSLAFQPCSSTQAFSNVAPGAHTLQAIGTDSLGNVGGVITRHFTVATPAPPAQPPAPPAAEEPTGDGTSTGQALTVKVGKLDRIVTPQEMKAVGLQFSVAPAVGAEVIRVRIFRHNRGGKATKLNRKHVMTFFKKAKGSKTVIKLSRKQLRKLRPGRYTIERTPGASRSQLGRASTRTFTITR